MRTETKDERDLETFTKGDEDVLSSVLPQIMDDPVLLAHFEETIRLCGNLETPESCAIHERRTKELMELLTARQH